LQKNWALQNLGIFPYLGEKNFGVHFVPNFITPKLFVVNVSKNTKHLIRTINLIKGSSDELTFAAIQEFGSSNITQIHARYFRFSLSTHDANAFVFVFVGGFATE